MQADPALCFIFQGMLSSPHTLLKYNAFKSRGGRGESESILETTENQTVCLIINKRFLAFMPAEQDDTSHILKHYEKWFLAFPLVLFLRRKDSITTIITTITTTMNTPSGLVGLTVL